MASNKSQTEFCFPLLPNSCPRLHRNSLVKTCIYLLLSLMILTTVLGNLLIIVSISHFKQLQSPTHLIVRSLAASDCLLGSLVMPYSMVRSVEGCWYLGDVFCKVHSSLDMTFCISSLLHLGLISVDRYWAICDPLKYQLRVTNKTGTVSTFSIWLFSSVYSFSVVFSGVTEVGLEMLVLQTYCLGRCIVFFNKQWSILAPLLTFFLPGTIMSSLYVKIFHVARKHVKVMSERATGGSKSQSSAQSERKAAKTLGIVMGVFLFCWLPFFTLIILNPFFYFLSYGEVFDAAFWFAYLNSTCNPLIYGFFYPCFQKAFKTLISTYICNTRSTFITFD